MRHLGSRSARKRHGSDFQHREEAAMTRTHRFSLLKRSLVVARPLRKARPALHRRGGRLMSGRGGRGRSVSNGSFGSRSVSPVR